MKLANHKFNYIQNNNNNHNLCNKEKYKNNIINKKV